MEVVDPRVFSPSGEYLAYSSPDGRLKLWETSTGTLQQEYTPASHLSATCTCICWCPTRHAKEKPVRRKKKKEAGEIDTPESSERVEMIAMGTKSGAVILYSIIEADLKTKMDGGHSDAVNCLAWDNMSDSLFSCSNDKYIVQWSISSGKVLHKWKGDKSAVYSVCLSPDRKQLLSASRCIKLWDIDTRSLLKVFIGHSSEVVCLRCITPSAAQESKKDGYYVLSSAAGDRLINAWYVKSAVETDKNAVASFSVTDEPEQLHHCISQSNRHPGLLAVATRQGKLHVFEYQLNGRCKKPLQPKLTLHIATSGDSGETPKPISVIGVHLLNDRQQNILIVYGDFTRPKFERLPYSTTENEVCLIRSDPKTVNRKVDKSITKVKMPCTSGEVTHLVPSHTLPKHSNVVKKRKLSTSEADESLAERLKSASVNGPTSEVPRTDTMAVLLTQGLQSQDMSMIDKVLTEATANVIDNTVRRLPVQAVVPLVQVLALRMSAAPNIAQTYIQWVKSILSTHTSFLMTFPELIEKLSVIYQIMDARLMMFTRMSRLKGKLDLIFSQVNPVEGKRVTDQAAMLVYQEESSDDDVDSDLGDLMPTSHSESEDNWENLSEEMDVEEVEENQDSEEDEVVTTKKKRKK
ncbi:PREDICTED: WD repeat-containing protein 43-like [Priapulus caudatus]|uniref:WD repeat-containing protein 43-like n=1 Tax=Priapulus caudatus TaxID=37621 RepID=A0ABM1DU14_PRICU|nr:PREDICTED: WD repeat-containing protein 43-like [Priapulus caudatus]